MYRRRNVLRRPDVQVRDPATRELNHRIDGLRTEGTGHSELWEEAQPSSREPPRARYDLRVTDLARPMLRGRLHQIAFFASLPAGALLVMTARDGLAAAVAAIYALSLAAVLGTSAAYHRGVWSPRARRWMRRLDHSLIFVLIAGSYTPVCVLALARPWTIVLLAIVWSGAIVGVTLKLIRIEGSGRLTAGLYVALGWVAVIALPEILRDVPAVTATLMIVGGVLYTLGAVVFASRRPDPSPAVFGYHEVWHAFVVAASACHYAMIYLLVRAAA